jgi:hypothetical protein
MAGIESEWIPSCFSRDFFVRSCGQAWLEISVYRFLAQQESKYDLHSMTIRKHRRAASKTAAARPPGRFRVRGRHPGAIWRTVAQCHCHCATVTVTRLGPRRARQSGQPGGGHGHSHGAMLRMMTRWRQPGGPVDSSPGHPARWNPHPFEAS